MSQVKKITMETHCSQLLYFSTRAKKRATGSAAKHTVSLATPSERSLEKIEGCEHFIKNLEKNRDILWPTKKHVVMPRVRAKQDRLTRYQICTIPLENENERVIMIGTQWSTNQVLVRSGVICSYDRDFLRIYDPDLNSVARWQKACQNRLITGLLSRLGYRFNTVRLIRWQL